MSQIELKPCPFCGSAQTDPEFDDNGSGPPPSKSLRCDDCGATGPFGYGKERQDYPGARVAAIKQWNTRAPSAGSEPVAWIVPELLQALQRSAKAGEYSTGSVANRRDPGLVKLSPNLQPLYASPPPDKVEVTREELAATLETQVRGELDKTMHKYAANWINYGKLADCVLARLSTGGGND